KARAATAVGAMIDAEWACRIVAVLSITEKRGGSVVLAPPPLARFRQRRHRVVVRVAATQRLRIVVLDAGAVVLRPVRDAAFTVVLGDLMHPPFTDVRHVAHDARGGVAGQ